MTGFHLLSDIWCCPSCRGTLALADDAVACAACGCSYPVIDGIPDLRLKAAAWLDLAADRVRAMETAARIESAGVEAAIRDVFAISRGFDERRVEFRTKQVFIGVDKCAEQIGGWLGPTLSHGGLFLDLGCGPGQMLAAAARVGIPGAGVDASMEWLVVAKHLIIRNGGTPLLAAGLAEHLPIRDQALAAVVSLDVIEHVGDQAAYVQGIARVLVPGGRFAISTPNRFSLSPEPHVSVWGVGFVPRRLQARYVKAVSGKPYAYTRLLSVWEARRLFSRRNGFEARVVFPPIAEHDIRLFGPAKATLARLYNRFLTLPFLRGVLNVLGAFYRVTGNVVADRPRAVAAGGDGGTRPRASGAGRVGEW